MLLTRPKQIGPLAFFLRWARLTPVLAFVILLYTMVVPYVGSGPFWHKIGDSSGACHTWWWTNLLYMNNFVPADYHAQCLPWTWYLANDTQMFAIMLPILYLYTKKKEAAIAVSAILIIVSVVTAWSISESMHLTDSSKSFQDALYDKPYTRMAPYFTGVLLNFAYRKEGWREKRLSTKTAYGLAVGSLLIIVGTILIAFKASSVGGPHGWVGWWSSHSTLFD